MATEMTSFETDDWGEPDETRFPEYGPDPAYLGGLAGVLTINRR